MTQTAENHFRSGIFVRRGDEVRLLGSRCTQCGALAFPRRVVCASCLSAEEPAAVELGPTGTLYTFATVRQAPKEFPTPYVIGYVDLDEGIRVFAQIAANSPEDLRLGMRVRSTLGLMTAGRNGEERVTYMFRADGEG